MLELIKTINKGFLPLTQLNQILISINNVNINFILEAYACNVNVHSLVYTTNKHHQTLTLNINNTYTYIYYNIN